MGFRSLTAFLLMKKVILIDGNAVGYLNLHGTVLKNADGQMTQSIFGFINLLIELKTKYSDAKLLVLWDGYAEFRYSIYPEYKGNRKPRTAFDKLLKEEYKRQCPIIREVIKSLGIDQTFNRILEADDLASIFTKKLTDNNYSVSLITTDRDWLQLVRENVVWHDLRDNLKPYGVFNFKAKAGVDSVERFLEKKSLMGDASDNISGVGGIGEKRVKELFKTFGSVRGFFRVAHLTKDLTSWEKKLLSREGREIYYRNIQLMDLIHPQIEDMSERVNIKGELDFDRFKQICLEQNFSTFTNKLDEIKRLFNEQN